MCELVHTLPQAEKERGGRTYDFFGAEPLGATIIGFSSYRKPSGKRASEGRGQT